jgi:hypothetical protein
MSPDGIGVVPCLQPCESNRSVITNDIHKLIAIFMTQDHLSSNTVQYQSELTQQVQAL